MVRSQLTRPSQQVSMHDLLICNTIYTTYCIVCLQDPELLDPCAMIVHPHHACIPSIMHWEVAGDEAA